MSVNPSMSAPRQSSVSSLSGSSSSLLHTKHEGLLSKWTNVVRGWQHRWFVLDPMQCTLEYYLTEEDRGSSPRASIKLPGSSVVPSHEDSTAFILHAANGEVFKLKAFDTKERQKWVNLLRCVISPGYGLQEPLNYSRSSTLPPDSSRSSLPRSSPSTKLIHFASEPPSMKFDEPFAPARLVISNVRDKRSTICKLIEDSELPSVTSDLLLLKATSLAAWDGLHHCLFALMNTEPDNGDVPSVDNSSLVEPEATPSGANQSPSIAALSIREADTVVFSSPRSISVEQESTIPEKVDDKLPESLPEMVTVEAPRLIAEKESMIFKSEQPAELSRMKESPVSLKRQNSRPPVFAEQDEEVTDAEIEEVDELGSVETEKSVILHLIGQLKIGMDLTKVTLPTFILERRSLLEMFADYMGHASVILRVPDMLSEEQRMVGVLEWYLTSFHIVRKVTNFAGFCASRSNVNCFVYGDCTGPGLDAVLCLSASFPVEFDGRNDIQSVLQSMFGYCT